MTKRQVTTSCRACGVTFRKLRAHETYCGNSCAVFSRVQRGGPDECWLWLGAKNDKGYGQLTINSQRVYAHRLAYEVTVGPLGAQVICHKCDTPLCCNPAHMTPGTQADNLADMRHKGRWSPAPARGERVGGAKLTADDVLAIRQRYAAGTETQRELGREFGVGQAQIWHIVQRRHWTHV